MSEYITTNELMEKYGISYETARRWCQSGRVKAKRIGKRWYIEKEALNDTEGRNQADA